MDLTLRSSLGLIILLSLAITIPFEIRRRRRLNKYWLRSCTGRDWKKRFPDVPKKDIRDFLEVFVDGFAFSGERRLKFNPDDRVMDIYRALYPTPGWADALELETFAKYLKERYGFELEKVTDYNITLGKIFEISRMKSNIRVE